MLSSAKAAQIAGFLSLASLSAAQAQTTSTLTERADSSYKAGVYAVWPNYDSYCGNIGSVSGVTETVCQSTCSTYTDANGNSCNGYTLTTANDPTSSTCYLKDFTCGKNDWTAHTNYDSGLEGGCTYWCGMIANNVDYSTCYNSDGSAWTCGSYSGGGLTPSARARRQRSLGKSPMVKRFECPANTTECPVRKNDGMTSSGTECVETESDLNQCGGCAGAGGVDCEKITHATQVGCGEAQKSSRH